MQDTTNVNSKLDEAIQKEAKASEAIRNKLAKKRNGRGRNKIHKVASRLNEGSKLNPSTPAHVPPSKDRNLIKKARPGKITDKTWKKFEEKICSLVKDKMKSLYSENKALKQLKKDNDKHFRTSSTRYTQ